VERREKRGRGRRRRRERRKARVSLDVLVAQTRLLINNQKGAAARHARTNDR
jgi:hypothetical protein